MNGDGRHEIIVSNSGANTISVWLNTGAADTFESLTSLVTASHPRGMIVDDFNNDNARDIAIACETSNSVQIFLGKGDGTFPSQYTYSVSGSPVSIFTSTVLSM